MKAMRSGRSSPGYMVGKPSWELTIWSSAEPPGAVDNQGPPRLGQAGGVVEGVGRPGLRFHTDGVGGLVEDDDARAIRLDRELERTRPPQHRRPGQVGEAVVPGPRRGRR